MITQRLEFNELGLECLKEYNQYFLELKSLKINSIRDCFLYLENTLRRCEALMSKLAVDSSKIRSFKPIINVRGSIGSCCKKTF